MPAYVIADVEVINAVDYEGYRQQVPATIAAHGGRYLARGGQTRTLEGNWSPRTGLAMGRRCTPVRFASLSLADLTFPRAALIGLFDVVGPESAEGRELAAGDEGGEAEAQLTEHVVDEDLAVAQAEAGVHPREGEHGAGVERVLAGVVTRLLAG